MENVQAKPGLFQKIVSFAIIGFLVLLLSGPIMTLVTFAFIGFVGWLIYRAFAMGKEVAWDDVGEAAKVVWKHVVQVAGCLCTWAGDLTYNLRTRFWPTVKSRFRAVARVAQSSAGYLVQILIEAASAGVIGALLGALLSDFSEASIISGGVIGAAIGGLYAARLEPLRRPSLKEDART